MQPSQTKYFAGTNKAKQNYKVTSLQQTK